MTTSEPTPIADRITRLLGPRLLVKPLPPEKTLNGIFLPDQARDDNNVGGPKIYRVLKVGTGRRLTNGTVLPMEVTIGDRVICHSYTTGPMETGDDRKIITESEVICVLPGAEEYPKDRFA